MISNFCIPALIYLIFGLTQVCLDVYQGYYNTGLMKMIVTIIFTLLLNAMCMSGMTVLAWLIIAIPFILMSIIISMLLFAFGLDPKTGRVINNINKSNIQDLSNSTIDYENAKEINKTKDKKKVDAREYELLYGDDDGLTKKDLLYLWNNRGNKNNSGNFFLNSDYLQNILGKKGMVTNFSLNNINMRNKKIIFKDDTGISKEIKFFNDNRVKYNSENGFYFINKNKVIINNNIKLKFENKKISKNQTIDVYDKDDKFITTLNIVSIHNI